MPTGRSTTQFIGDNTIASRGVEATEYNAGRRFFVIKNESDTDMRISFSKDMIRANQGMLLKAGESFSMEGSYVLPDRVTIFCSAEGKRFSGYEA